MKKIILVLTIIFTIGISSCKKDFLDQSINPDAPSTTTIQFTLSGAEKGMADIVNGWGSYTGTQGLFYNYAIWAGVWAPSSGFIIVPAVQEYVITTNTFQSWTDLYDNLSNINNLVTLGAASNSNYEAIGLIMEAFDFQELVDNYNDVPYSQAFKSPSVLFPAYDKGQTIYNSLIKSLDTAIGLINNSKAATPGNDDIIFGGNMSSWAKFANSLKLRLLLRQSNLVNVNTFAAEVASTSSAGYLDGTTQAEAQAGYSLSDSYGGQESPFWLVYGTNQSGSFAANNVFCRAATYAVNMMNNFNDPRITYLYATIDGSTNASEVMGVTLGDPNINGIAANAISKIGPGLLQSASMPAMVFSGAESLFLQAEAVQRGMLTSTSSAQQLYQAAITASFQTLGLTAAQATAYYSQNIANVGWTASSANYIQAIITQKYIALNGYGNLEIYNELRRTGYPTGIPRSEDPTSIGPSNLLPSRLLYPQIEYDTNVNNVDAEGNIDEFNSLIFWAKPYVTN